MHGSLWRARAQDHATLVEGALRPLYETVFDAVGLRSGRRLLDAGCGPGLAAHLAARCSALAARLDAAEVSLLIASERTPEGDFRVGDLEELLWPDDSFDVVTSFNAIKFAGDITTALREARRGG